MKLWWIQISRYALPYTRGLSMDFLLMVLGTGLEVLKPCPLKLIADYVFKERLPPDTVPDPIFHQEVENLRSANQAWISQK